MIYGYTGQLAYRDVVGQNYTYRQWSDGTIKILAGPSGVGMVLQSGDQHWDAITVEIGGFPGTSQEQDYGAGQVEGTQAWWQNVLSAFVPGTATAQGAGAVAQAAVTGIAQLIQQRKTSLTGLSVKLGKLQAQYIKAAGNPAKQASLRAQIQTVQFQIEQLQQAIATKAPATSAELAAPGGGASVGWLPWLIGGVALFGVVVIAFAGGRK